MDRQEDVLVLFMTLARLGRRHRAAAAGTGQQRTQPRGRRRRARPRGHSEPHHRGVGLLFWRVRAAAGERQYRVLTAADEKSTSFGCSNEREWTYFGDAFNQHLKPDVTLEQAFLNARVTIGQWEARDGLTPSNPARALRAGAGREARAAWRVASGPRHAALMGAGRPLPRRSAGMRSTPARRVPPFAHILIQETGIHFSGICAGFRSPPGLK